MAVHVRQLTPENLTMRCHTPIPKNGSERGVVLPIALIMLVIISFAGLLAARNSATFEQFSNNMRTNQVARTSAEDALRQCERIARASVEDNAAFAAVVGRIEAGTVISVETTLNHPRRGFIKLEDTVLVTDNGHEIFGEGLRDWNRAGI